ncbi:uncharacterized protein LOC115695841 [Cannabis sativa]|uniref:uncharacterized protein LOC115695841 n=1 Tax=Cannabis sativa TaxID=3483 RepID=UPI0011E01ABA|nr:uncharacterized protein LOC115695841 [Cannabis sativa]
MRNFKKYSELITCLLVAEKNNELLMKNHQSRPTGSMALPEVNATNYNNYGRGRGRGQSQGRGCGRNQGRGRNGHNSSERNSDHQRKRQHADENVHGNYPQNPEDSCYRCGTKGHWSRTCHTTKHLCDLYQISVKEKEKEVNLIEQYDPVNDSTHLDAQ